MFGRCRENYGIRGGNDMKKKVIFATLGVILVGGLVFGGLMLTRERLDYAGAAVYVADIVSEKEAVQEFLNGEVGALDEETRGALTNYRAVASRIDEQFRSLEASSALKDEEVRAQYDELSKMAGKFAEMAEVVGWLVELVDGIGEGGYAAEIMPAPNAFAEVMAKEIGDYRWRVSEFATKYGDGKADDYKAMTEEYGVILVAGEELEAKYANVKLVDVVGVSDEEVGEWFGRLDELEAILREKQ